MHDRLGHELRSVPGCARCDLKSVISAIGTCSILPILGIGALRIRHAYSRCNGRQNDRRGTEGPVDIDVQLSCVVRGARTFSPGGRSGN